MIEDDGYKAMFQKVVNRFNNLLKPRTDFEPHPLTNVEENPLIIPSIKSLLEKLGVNLPEDDNGEAIKTVIAMDLINWMKTERPDVLHGMIELTDESLSRF